MWNSNFAHLTRSTNNNKMTDKVIVSADKMTEQIDYDRVMNSVIDKVTLQWNPSRSIRKACLETGEIARENFCAEDFYRAYGAHVPHEYTKQPPSIRVLDGMSFPPLVAIYNLLASTNPSVPDVFKCTKMVIDNEILHFVSFEYAHLLLLNGMKRKEIPETARQEVWQRKILCRLMGESRRDQVQKNIQLPAQACGLLRAVSQLGKQEEAAAAAAAQGTQEQLQQQQQQQDQPSEQLASNKPGVELNDKLDDLLKKFVKRNRPHQKESKATKPTAKVPKTVQGSSASSPTPSTVATQQHSDETEECKESKESLVESEAPEAAPSTDPEVITVEATTTENKGKPKKAVKKTKKSSKQSKQQPKQPKQRNTDDAVITDADRTYLTPDRTPTSSTTSDMIDQQADVAGKVNSLAISYIRANRVAKNKVTIAGMPTEANEINQANLQAGVATDITTSAPPEPIVEHEFTPAPEQHYSEPIPLVRATVNAGLDGCNNMDAKQSSTTGEKHGKATPSTAPVASTTSSSESSSSTNAVTTAVPQADADFVQPPIDPRFTSNAVCSRLGWELLMLRVGEWNDIIRLSEQALELFPNKFLHCKESSHDLSWSVCRTLFGPIIDQVESKNENQRGKRKGWWVERLPGKGMERMCRIVPFPGHQRQQTAVAQPNTSDSAVQPTAVTVSLPGPPGPPGPLGPPAVFESMVVHSTPSLTNDQGVSSSARNMKAKMIEPCANDFMCTDAQVPDIHAQIAEVRGLNSAYRSRAACTLCRIHVRTVQLLPCQHLSLCSLCSANQAVARCGVPGCGQQVISRHSWAAKID